VAFDSFEGRPEPSELYDEPFWQAGQYTESFEPISEAVRLAERPHLQLVKGGLKDSLISPDDSEGTRSPSGRIDCDIYEPAVECLEYLSSRLSSGSILDLMTGRSASTSVRARRSQSGYRACLT